MKLRVLLLAAALIIVLVIIGTVFLTSQHPPAPTTKQTVVFDFDNGSPALTTAQNTPFNQTTAGLTASFSSPSDPNAFAINNDDNVNLRLTNFSGMYLADIKDSRDILDIKFSKQILDVKVTFATVEQQSESIKIPSDVLITVYNNTGLLGSNRAYGTFSTDSYPQGTLTYFSGAPFNWIRISVPSQSTGTTDFIVDNITVSVVSKAAS